MYILFFVIGLLALLGPIFVERGVFRKILIVLSVVSFLGLGYLAYRDARVIEMLTGQLASANKDLDRLKKYEYVSHLTHTGSEQIFFYTSDPNYPLIPQGLPEILIDTYEVTDEFGSIAYKCDAASQERYSKAIKLNPDYPFSYLALAHCKKQSGAQDWRGYASKALEIFEITTKIGGHHSEHDVALEVVQKLINQK